MIKPYIKMKLQWILSVVSAIGCIREWTVSLPTVSG